MPVPTETVLPAEWPGVEVRRTGNGKYLLVTLTDDADRHGLACALRANAVGLKLHNVTEAGELVFLVRPSLAWVSVVDTP